MKTVIIVSKCLRVTKFKSCEYPYEFHFKGICAGEVIKKVILSASNEISFLKGEEYLLYVSLISMESGILKGRVIKSKRLDECWDRS